MSDTTSGCNEIPVHEIVEKRGIPMVTNFDQRLADPTLTNRIPVWDTVGHYSFQRLLIFEQWRRFLQFSTELQGWKLSDSMDPTMTNPPRTVYKELRFSASITFFREHQNEEILDPTTCQIILMWEIFESIVQTTTKSGQGLLHVF